MWLGQQSGKGGVHASSTEPGARSRLERPGTGCLPNPDAELVCGRESFPAPESQALVWAPGSQGQGTP